MAYNKHFEEFDHLLKKFAEARGMIMAKAGTMALAFFKENFRRQGFLNRGLEPWAKRISGTPHDSGRPLGLGYGPGKGVMKRGLQRKSVSRYKVVIGVDPAIRYAEIQNNGGEIPITNKMRRFFWAMYYKANGKMEYDGNKMAKNTQRNIAAASEAEFWKNLALTKKRTLTIKARPFIGDSVTLEAEIVAMFEQEIGNVFNNTFKV